MMLLARPLEVVWAVALALGVEDASSAAEFHAWLLTWAAASLCDFASGAAHAAGAAVAVEVDGVAAASVAAAAKVLTQSSPRLRANNTSSA